MPPTSTTITLRVRRTWPLRVRRTWPLRLWSAVFRNSRLALRYRLPRALFQIAYRRVIVEEQIPGTTRWRRLPEPLGDGRWR